MNKVSLSIALGAVISAGTAASADFTGFDGVVSEVGAYTVVQMYATYDRADVALNVFNADISTADGLGFNQSDVQAIAGGTWSPASTLDIPGFSDSSIDSYVNMGYAPGGTNGTALDPTFTGATGGLGATIPTNAGWYNGNPGSDVFAGAVAGFDYAVMIGQFVFETSRATDDPEFFTFSAEMGSKDENGEVFFASDTYVPAPGALALLGLAGVAARRRRG